MSKEREFICSSKDRIGSWPPWAIMNGDKGKRVRKSDRNEGGEKKRRKKRLQYLFDVEMHGTLY